jgi:hypothetical protein
VRLIDDYTLRENDECRTPLLLRQDIEAGI